MLRGAGVTVQAATSARTSTRRRKRGSKAAGGLAVVLDAPSSAKLEATAGHRRLSNVFRGRDRFVGRELRHEMQTLARARRGHVEKPRSLGRIASTLGRAHEVDEPAIVVVDR